MVCDFHGYSSDCLYMFSNAHSCDMVVVINISVKDYIKKMYFCLIDEVSHSQYDSVPSTVPSTVPFSASCQVM